MTREDRRGGRRPGAGRPAAQGEPWRLLLRVTPDERAAIEAEAEARGVSIGRLLVDAALREAREAQLDERRAAFVRLVLGDSEG